MRVLAGFTALALIVGGTLFTLLRPTETELAVPAPPPPPAVRIIGPRVWFAASNPTTLALPDGSHRAILSMLNTRQSMRFGDFEWNDDGVPAGPVWVRIDLAKQIISAFRGPHEIGTAVILYGTDGKPTPIGSFHVLWKSADYRSHTYDAEMPFMLRLTDDGVAIHASAVRQGSATHGCIGVPADFARHLFGQVKRGDLVAILPADATTAHAS